MSTPSLCRDCLSQLTNKVGNSLRCQKCASPRIIAHNELNSLTIAHIDCDAFYASVEKRDDPRLKDRPVIVGGGNRGVVSAACYIARRSGVSSAMPMFKALKLCPDATVIRPDIKKYAAASDEIRCILSDYTPLIEPLSLDEAFLDLNGTEKLHDGPASRTLAAIIKRIERELCLPASVGLSYNKFLAKIASDIDKPRGFAVLGHVDAFPFLSTKPVQIIWGVGNSLRQKLKRDGLITIQQLQKIDEKTLINCYGKIGKRLSMFAKGEDDRLVNPTLTRKTISSETTFEHDTTNLEFLAREIWKQSEIISNKLKNQALAGTTIHLKLKTSDHKLLTRSSRLTNPTQLARIINITATQLLKNSHSGATFRLVGVIVSDLVKEKFADPIDLGAPDDKRQADAEKALDSVRRKFGLKSIMKGRGLSIN